MKQYLTIVLLLLPLLAVGQTAKSEPLFERAVEKSVVGQYEEAIKLLDKALEIDPTYAEAWLLLGNQYMALTQYSRARECYQHCLDLNPKSTRWRQEAQDGIRTAEWRQHAVENPVPYHPINLGSNINTPDDEYMPALTADYRTLVFTRRSPRNAYTQRGLPQEEDFYISYYDTMELVFGPAERIQFFADALFIGRRVDPFFCCRPGEFQAAYIPYRSTAQDGREGINASIGQGYGLVPECITLEDEA